MKVCLTSVSKHSQHLGKKKSHFFKRVCEGASVCLWISCWRETSVSVSSTLSAADISFCLRVASLGGPSTFDTDKKYSYCVFRAATEQCCFRHSSGLSWKGLIRKKEVNWAFVFCYLIFRQVNRKQKCQEFPWYSHQQHNFQLFSRYLLYWFDLRSQIGQHLFSLQLI